MGATLASLDFGVYRRLLGVLLPDMAGMLVQDAEGVAVVRDACFQDAPAAGLAEQSVSLRQDDDQVALGTLTARHSAALDVETARRGMAEIAALIARECLREDELNAMAGELAERYDELNMVYATEDRGNSINQGQAMLQQLVKHYTQFTGSNLTILLLPNHRIGIVEHAAGARSADAETLSAWLRAEVLPLFAAGMDSLALNTSADAAAHGLRGAMPYKLIAQPILADHTKVSGLLAAINGPREADFSNSDRNLLAVMARKAAKIIQSNFDATTGLMLRAGFEHQVRMALSLNQSRGEQACALEVNIDRMKVVNDTLGREAGDALIAHVGELIREQVRDTDWVARLGGDEFGVLLGNCSPEQALRVAEKLSQRARQSDFTWRGERLDVSLGIGIVPLGNADDSVEQILTTLELTCHAAKERGLDQIQVYQPDDADLAARKEAMYWVGRLQSALREDRFRLYAQLIAPMNPASHRTHYEVLIRLPGDDGRVIPPGIFLPPAERYGLMPAIDRWVFKHLLDDLSRQWRETGKLDVVFSFNLSGPSLTDQVFLEYVLAELALLPFPLDRLIFEITETAAIARLERAKRFIAEVKAMGCGFALDDFGSGLSSYSYLKNLDVDLVKIDGSFVSNILEDPVSDVMVQSVIAIARQMGIATVAEFVETMAIHERLRVLGVDFAQGYALGKPAPLSDLLAQLSLA